MPGPQQQLYRYPSTNITDTGGRPHPCERVLGVVVDGVLDRAVELGEPGRELLRPHERMHACLAAL